jgi:hypothetical protein
VNNPAIDEIGHTNSESSITVWGPRILIGFNDASKDVSGYAISTDGGTTFTHRRLPPPFEGQNLGSPSVSFGPDGEAYYARVILDSDDVSSIGVSRSDDGGATFSDTVDAAIWVSYPLDLQDKPQLAVDRGTSSPHIGNVYVTWTAFVENSYAVILFARSTDGGISFDPPWRLSPVDGAGVQSSHIAVAPNGTIYVAFEDYHLSPGGITLMRSMDGGLSWAGPKTIATFTPIEILTGGGGVRASSYPVIAVDGKDTLHVAWAAASPGTQLDRADIFYARSTNSGATFSSPKKLNDDGTVSTQAFPAISATADGKVAVTWSDRRNDPGNDGLTDIYMTVSSDSGVSFGKNFRITDQNWGYGPVESHLASHYHGEYDGLTSDGSNFYLSWSDERGTDPDVFFSLVPQDFDSSGKDFGISAEKLHYTLRAAQTAVFDLSTFAVNGFTGDLSLSARSENPGADGLTYTFSPDAIAAGGSAKLMISASPSARAGDHIVTVSASSGSITRATTIRVSVYPASRTVAPPVNLTSTPGFTAGAGIKTDPPGTTHFVFEDDSLSVQGSDVFYRRSTDGGRTFSSAQKLNGPDSIGTDSALATDGSGRVLVVWTGRRSSDSNTRVFLARSTDGGITFSTPVPVTPTSHEARFPAVATDGAGNVLIAYYQVGQDPSTLQTIRSTDGGGIFASPLEVPDDNAAQISRPGLTFDSKGTAYLSYTSQTTSVGALTSVARLTVASPGQRFSTPITVSDSKIANAFGPDVAIAPDGSVYVAFYNRIDFSSFEANRDVVVIRSTDGGKTFSPQVNISNNPGQSYFPTIFVEPSGALDVAWEDSSDNSATDILISRSTDGGKTFSSPFNLSSSPGLSGSSANPVAPVQVGGSGRVALSAGPAGTILAIYTDDSGLNPDIFLNIFSIPALTNQPPSASITNPLPGVSVEAGVPVTFSGSASDPEGGPLTVTWDFGDGKSASELAPAPHVYPVPGTYIATLSVSDQEGATVIASVSITVTTPSATGASLFIPVVLDAPGEAASHYETEVTLVSRAGTPANVVLSYTASAGGGSGYARISLAPGEMRTLPGIVAFLRDHDVPIPADESPKIGTLLVTFEGVNDSSLVYAGARTYTGDPSGKPGSFGLSYPAGATVASSATIFGLQQNASMRSNVAVANAGVDPVTLRISMQGPGGEDLGTLPDLTLPAHGWAQVPQPLSGKAESGRATVTRVSGTGAFTAYGVLNDTVTSDGSFLAAITAGDASGADRLVPVVLDASGIGSRYRTELTLTNLGTNPLDLTLVYRAAEGFGSGSGSVSLWLAPGEQRIIGDIIAFLRAQLPIENDGRNVGGSLLVRAPAGTAASSLAVGARTFTPASPSGSYGLFYTGLSLDESASSAVFVYGLKEDSAQRSNLAIVNRGDSSDAITLRITYFSANGKAAGSSVERTLSAGEWFQFVRPLSEISIPAGYAKVERISGRSRFVAYGVVNDNSTSDGSYVLMAR